MPATHPRKRKLSTPTTCLPFATTVLLPSNRPATLAPRRGTTFRSHEALQFDRKHYSGGSDDGTFAESLTDAFAGSLGVDEESEPFQSLMDILEDSEEDGRFRAQLSRSARKAKRQSRPATVLAAINGPARDLYYFAPPNMTDLSYANPRSSTRKRKSNAIGPRDVSQVPEPISLYSILARYLEYHTSPQPD